MKTRISHFKLKGQITNHTNFEYPLSTSPKGHFCIFSSISIPDRYLTNGHKLNERKCNKSWQNKLIHIYINPLILAKAFVEYWIIDCDYER